jgi:hypothetical protein
LRDEVGTPVGSACAKGVERREVGVGRGIEMRHVDQIGTVADDP